MTDNNELRVQRDLQAAVRTITITGGMLPDPQSEIIVRHNEEIESLKTKIQEKDEEILRLNKEIKRLRAENDRKDKKIEQLENRIEELEHDKTDLETKLDSVQKQVTNLKEENKASREKVDNLETKLNSVEVENAAVKKEVTRLKEENKAFRKEADDIKLAFQINEEDNIFLRKEVKNVKEALRKQTSSLYLPDVSEQAIDKAFLCLAEMCSRIQSMMYQSVHPDSYDERSWYQIEEIEEDIEKEIKDTGPKEEAKRRWADLKKTLKWDQESHLKMIKSLKWRRNKTAHPPLDETTLTESLDVMKRYDEIGSREAARIEELIHMWKTLKQLQPKL